MEFLITERQARKSIDLVLNIYEHFIKENEIEKTFDKIVINALLKFSDNYRSDVQLNDTEIFYAGKNEYGEPMFEFLLINKNGFVDKKQKDLYELCIWLSYADDIDYYFE